MIYERDCSRAYDTYFREIISAFSSYDIKPDVEGQIKCDAGSIPDF